MGNPVFDVAFKRAALGGLVIAATTFFTLLPQTDDWRLIVSGVGGAFVGTLAARWGIEGTVDNNRAKEGKVIAGDVPMASDKLDVVKKA